MIDLHRAYLNIGSNIQPELNLPRAIKILEGLGSVQSVSTAWESHAIGIEGPNFLNICLLFLTSLGLERVKYEIIRPVETSLKRFRGLDRNAPRTIDIDIVMWDGEALKPENWMSAYTVVPMAELDPGLEHPVTHERLSDASQRMRTQTWILPRPEVFRKSDMAD
jgi:2-amino-4-hydroxy-6-hydroxymethyldihydropteridine diphosphokinase